jgi:uncharacterized protein
MEKTISIPVGKIQLEAIIHAGSPAKAGIVAHPHPLYGGSMHNHVVETAYRVLITNNYTALKFNFRGVGAGTGQFDEGIGEQDDLEGVTRFLKDNGIESIVVIGYSFGAWVAAHAWKRLALLNVRPLILIAPPAAFMSFKDLDDETSIGRLVCGEYDDIAPPHPAAELGARLKHPVVPDIIPKTDHFFGGRSNELSRIIEDAVLSV